MEKSFFRKIKIKNKGELIVFILFFLFFTIQIILSSESKEKKNLYHNYKENIERIKNELKEMNNTSLKTTNLKKNTNNLGIVHIIIWLFMILVCILFFILNCKRNFNREFIVEEDVEYTLNTVQSSNLETNDESLFKEFFL
jgi:Na+/H+ antiporter NhaC